MAEAKKRLGRGLNSLLSSTRLQEEETVTKAVPKEVVKVTQIPSKDQILDIEVEKVTKNPHQPRQKWDEAKLFELSESIKANGLVQPIIVRQMGDSYQLIAGERRLRASEMAGITTIPAIIKDATEEQMLEWALIENIHRADLSPLERANAYQRYIKSFSLNQSEAAERLGEDRSTIANYMRLLDLPEDIKTLLNEGALSMGHARALLGVKPEIEQIKLAIKAVEGGYSVRQLEREIQQRSRTTEEVKPAKPEKNANVIDQEREWTRSLGTKVSIKTAGKKAYRGKIIIEYYSLDDFDRIRDKILYT